MKKQFVMACFAIVPFVSATGQVAPEVKRLTTEERQAISKQALDPYLWLEEVEGEKAMKFVNEQNKITVDKLQKSESYKEIYENCLKMYNATDKIAYPSVNGDYTYNFWKDEKHVRGIWRRTTNESYLSGKPQWETLLDIDAMSEKDGVKWVFAGATPLFPDFNLFLVSLSKGGGDATIIREFDPSKKEFIDGGFALEEEAKGGVSYLSKDLIVVSRGSDNEDDVTTSGYPRKVKLWQRGTRFSKAVTIFEGDKNDVGAWGTVLRDGQDLYACVIKAKTFYSSDVFVRYKDKMIKLDIPDDSSPSAIISGQAILQLKSDWKVNNKTYTQGSVISLDFKELLLKGNKKITTIFVPNETSSVSDIASTKNRLMMVLLKDVKSELYNYAFANGKWESKKVNAPDFGSIGLASTDDFSDNYFFTYTNFLTPTTLYVADAGKNTFEKYQSLPAYFDGSTYKVEQFKIKSTDGTLVPYFVVSSKDLKLDGKNPTLLYGYGGFEISLKPNYSGTIGQAWLDKGGVYVLSNIRGGGEFGPKWHQSGLKEKRQNVYDDFHAIAEDLTKRNITSGKHLGIKGGSNGGLLVGVAFTQRPDLYNAVVCQVPLLDMKRYNKLLAGASWMGEYGDPDKEEEWAYIQKYSPYHNLKKDAKYPEVFFYTSTRDDRVHPGHARKMAAKMIDMGYPVMYYENIEGGHGGASTNEQSATAAALEYSYLLTKLK